MEEELDNEEMADLMIGILEHAEMEFGYDFGAVLSIEDDDDGDPHVCKITMYVNRQVR